MNNKSNDIVGLVVIAIIASIITGISGILAFFEGPNIAHKTNLIAILAVIYNFIKLSHIRDKSDKWTILLVYSLTIFAGFIAFGLLTVKYGYTNWHFQSLWNMKYIKP
jgi:hypothetical protein